MNEQEIIDTFDKSIWDMSPQELIEYHLDDFWVSLVDLEAGVTV